MPMIAGTTLENIVGDIASGISRVDASRPVAVNQRSGAQSRPGIGPHTETNTLRMVMQELSMSTPGRYSDYKLGVSYADRTRQACDLCIGTEGSWQWAIEVKMLRLMGDNGKPNDNILMHILSPYPAHRSALTDCSKLRRSSLECQQAIIIYGYDYDG